MIIDGKFVTYAMFSTNTHIHTLTKEYSFQKFCMQNIFDLFIYAYIYIDTYMCIMYMVMYVCMKQNAHNDGNRAQPLKRLLKTLFLAIKKCTGFTTDVI